MDAFYQEIEDKAGYNDLSSNCFCQQSIKLSFAYAHRRGLCKKEPEKLLGNFNEPTRTSHAAEGSVRAS